MGLLEVLCIDDVVLIKMLFYETVVILLQIFKTVRNDNMVERRKWIDWVEKVET